MAEQNINVNQTATDSSGVTQIGVQYTGDVHHHHYAPGSKPQRTTVTLELAQEQVDVSKLIALIAGLTQAGVQDIKLVGVRLGSLIVTLDMPAEAAQKLGVLALNRPELFAEFQLVNVSIDLPPPSVAPPAARPARPQPRPSPLKALLRLIKRLLFIAGVLVVVGGVALIIWLYGPQLGLTPPAAACRIAAARGSLPIYAAPSSRVEVIGELEEAGPLDVVGRWEQGGWWLVRFGEGAEGWVQDRAVRLSGACESVPPISAGAGPEPCAATVLWPGELSRLNGALREGPSVTYPMFARLPEGEAVHVLERTEDGRWWLVLSEASEVEGWMAESSLDLRGDCQAVPARPAELEPEGAGEETLNPELPPRFGEDELAAGFLPDPFTVELLSGGEVNVGELLEGICEGPARGHASMEPSFRLHYQAGSFPLRIYFLGEGDTTLVVHAPDGRWYCDDDDAGDYNPLLAWDDPLSGPYTIWVGTYGAGEQIPGALHISASEGP